MTEYTKWTGGRLNISKISEVEDIEMIRHRNDQKWRKDLRGEKKNRTLC